MFTGIVEELGEVTAVTTRGDSVVLTVSAPLVATGATHGESIAVNGVCLTVVDPADGAFTADVMKESLDRSALADLAVGSRVNVERAMALGDRLGGHIVQGHVDGVGEVLARTPGDAWEVVRFSLPDALSRYLVLKGSVTVDGVSLTVSGLGDDWFEVSLIPTTLAETTLGTRAVGERVNLEADVLAKHVERLMLAKGEL